MPYFAPSTKPARPRYDLIAKHHPRTLAPEDVAALHDAPLAQPPRNAKKFVFVTPNGVYKGPFNGGHDRDVRAIQNVQFRTEAMRSWGNEIVLPHELVIEPDATAFCSIGASTISRAERLAHAVSPSPSRPTLRASLTSVRPARTGNSPPTET